MRPALRPGIAVDSSGVIDGAEVAPNDLKKYVKQ